MSTTQPDASVTGSTALSAITILSFSARGSLPSPNRTMPASASFRIAKLMRLHHFGIVTLPLTLSVAKSLCMSRYLLDYLSIYPTFDLVKPTNPIAIQRLTCLYKAATMNSKIARTNNVLHISSIASLAAVIGRNLGRDADDTQNTDLLFAIRGGGSG